MKNQPVLGFFLEDGSAAALARFFFAALGSDFSAAFGFAAFGLALPEGLDGTTDLPNKG